MWTVLIFAEKLRINDMHACDRQGCSVAGDSRIYLNTSVDKVTLWLVVYARGRRSCSVAWAWLCVWQTRLFYGMLMPVTDVVIPWLVVRSWCHSTDTRNRAVELDSTRMVRSLSRLPRISLSRSSTWQRDQCQQESKMLTSVCLFTIVLTYQYSIQHVNSIATVVLLAHCLGNHIILRTWKFQGIWQLSANWWWKSCHRKLFVVNCSFGGTLINV